MLFANGLQRQFSELLATHPPILERIQRLGMKFDNQDLARLAVDIQQISGSFGRNEAYERVLKNQAEVFCCRTVSPVLPVFTKMDSMMNLCNRRVLCLILFRLEFELKLESGQNGTGSDSGACC